MAPDREAGGIVCAPRAFKPYFSPLVIIITAADFEVVIGVVVFVDFEFFVIVIGNDQTVFVRFGAVIRHAARDLAGGRLFFFLTGAFDDHVIVFAHEFLGFFFVFLGLFLGFGGVFLIIPDDGVVLFLGVVIIIFDGFDGGAGGLGLHFRDGRADDFVFRIELRAAFGADGGAFVKVVESRLAGRTDLLGSELVLGHLGALLLVGGKDRWEAGALAMNARRCQRPNDDSNLFITGPSPMVWTSRPVRRIAGSVRAPGDKSCSHRALIFGGLASGTSSFTGLLEGDDVIRTGRAMSALGAEVANTGPGVWEITGVGEQGLTSPAGELDFGNSGTGSRLMMGVMAGFKLTAALTGDASLSSRPMNRVLRPLREMGLKDTAGPEGRLPFTLTGSSELKAIHYAPPQASAQVKSAVLLAGLNAVGATTVVEAKATRDHTERMLQGFGVKLGFKTAPGGATEISIEGKQPLFALDAAIPGDPSSAAFLIAAGILSRQGDVLVEGVMSNPTRSGFYDAANLMGASLGAEERGLAAGERLIDLHAGYAGLKGIAVPERLVASMIDEFPILAVLAAFATGETRVTGAHELRVKESDRIKAIVAMLCVNGVGVEETEDGFIVEGCGGPVPGGGLVETRHDHRIAMSALVMGTAALKAVSVDDVSMIDTSYPEFLGHMAQLGAEISEG